MSTILYYFYFNFLYTPQYIIYISPNNPVVVQISNRIAYTCEHSNFRPVLRESKINSSASSIDDGDELFFFEIGLGDELPCEDGDATVHPACGVSAAVHGALLEGVGPSIVVLSRQKHAESPQHTLRMCW